MHLVWGVVWTMGDGRRSGSLFVDDWECDGEWSFPSEYCRVSGVGLLERGDL